MIINAGISNIVIRDTETIYREISVDRWVREDDIVSIDVG